VIDQAAAMRTLPGRRPIDLLVPSFPVRLTLEQWSPGSPSTEGLRVHRQSMLILFQPLGPVESEFFRLASSVDERLMNPRVRALPIHLRFFFNLTAEKNALQL
jgi:hypothetical protein